ncbi:MAG: hypothetical protein GC181_02590 [Bacteroidetes bacterium]|nr:hypothetical protein [Bacteroidota bacterium]
MSTTPFHIILIAYNRPESFRRLLLSIDASCQNLNPVADVTLCLDGNYHPDHDFIFEEWNWPFGLKKVIRQERNLGVDQHVEFCLKLASDYAFNLFLEDDHYITRRGFRLVEEFINSDADCAGYSLHNYSLHPITRLPFQPVDRGDGYYLLTRISSYGLFMTGKQAGDCYNWLQNKHNSFNLDYPPHLDSYGSHAWESRFTKYLIANKKYLMFPVISGLTVFGEKGAHFRGTDDRHLAQCYIPLHDNVPKIPNRPLLKYDAWYELEPESFKELLPDSVFTEFDLNGTKKFYHAKNVVTIKPMKNPVKTFGLDFKPAELNVIWNNPGNEISYGPATNVLKENRWQLQKRKKFLRWYHNQRYSLFELLYHLYQRIFQNTFKAGK